MLELSGSNFRGSIGGKKLQWETTTKQIGKYKKSQQRKQNLSKEIDDPVEIAGLKSTVST